MKRIETIIRPARLDDVREALIQAGILGATALDASGYGRQLGHSEMYRGSEYVVTFLPKVLLIVYVSDDKVDAAVNAIQAGGRTGKNGDGVIVVSEIETIIRIRTGETNGEVL